MHLVDRFYQALHMLLERIGDYRYLLYAEGSMLWPNRGVYFFFEPGETRFRSDELRVVRVGTHAVSRGSRTSLWDRLRAHRGSLSGSYAGGGNHRGSIFRLHVGTAFLRKRGLEDEYPTWSVGSSTSRDIRFKEHRVEMLVSQHIRSMPFLWLKVDDTPGPNSERAYLERNSIALLSNFNRIKSGLSVDPPSENWLGKWCRNEYVRKSGLWNVEHVTEAFVDLHFLDRLKARIEDM